MSNEEQNIPDFTVVKIPQFWDYTRNRNEWKRIEQVNTIQNCSIEHESINAGASSSLEALPTTKKNVQYNSGKRCTKEMCSQEAS